MTIAASAESPGSSQLVVRMLQFGRTLRAAGLPIGPGKILDALASVEVVGLADRETFREALAASLLSRRSERHLFEEAFTLFWSHPRLFERMLAELLPRTEFERPAGGKPLSRRLAEMTPPPNPAPQEKEQENIEFDTSLTWSRREILQQKDFEQMSRQELALVKRVIADLAWNFRPRATRRYHPDARGPRVDKRKSMRRLVKASDDVSPLPRLSVTLRPPPLIVLCDISGSISRYSRVLLHFMHGLSTARQRVHSFLFGTRLTCITPFLRHRDVDIALAEISAKVQDWAGGTRIGESLHEFNYIWSRRVLAAGSAVLLITDGLERESHANLGQEMARLQRSCHRLIWLNPLLRYDAYQPIAQGARAMLPYCDEFRPIHNLDSVADLARALARPAPPRPRHQHLAQQFQEKEAG